MTWLGADLLKHLQWLARAAPPRPGGPLEQASPAGRNKGAPWSDRRDYSPGDDWRWIDWGVCARHDELISRRPPEPADRCVHVLVDCSRSMSIGRPTKFDVARRAAAVLGTAALARLDQLAVTAFADRIAAELPPTRGESRRLRMLRFLDGLTPAGTATDLARAAERLVERRQRPGPAVVIGDFFAPQSYCRGLEILRQHGYAPSAVHVCDRGDAEPDLLGDVELCDVESGQRWAAVLGPRDLARYRALYDDFCGSIRAFCRRRAIGYLRVQEGTPWQQII